MKREPVLPTELAADLEAGDCEYTVDGHHVPIIERTGFWPWQRRLECWLCEQLIDGSNDG